jgi:hypothetical protein
MSSFKSQSANQATNDLPRPQTITERTSVVLSRLHTLNATLENVLSRVRGAQPSPIDGGLKPEPVPNLELMLTRLENTLCETESHISEFDRSI